MAKPARTEVGRIVLADVIERFIDMGFEDAIANFTGLADLIAHHPGYREEAAAMRKLEASRDLLAKTSWDTRNL